MSRGEYKITDYFRGRREPTLEISRQYARNISREIMAKRETPSQSEMERGEMSPKSSDELLRRLIESKKAQTAHVVIFALKNIHGHTLEEIAEHFGVKRQAVHYYHKKANDILGIRQ